MTTESKLIEDMARAICEAHGNNPDQNFAGLLGNRPRPAWMAYEHQAKAALAVAFPAIRERCAAEADVQPNDDYRDDELTEWGLTRRNKGREIAAAIRALSLDAPPAVAETPRKTPWEPPPVACSRVNTTGCAWPRCDCAAPPAVAEKGESAAVHTLFGNSFPAPAAPAQSKGESE